MAISQGPSPHPEVHWTPGLRQNANPSYGYREGHSYWVNYRKANPIVKEGKDAFAHGNFARAESLARKALTVHNRHSEAYLLLAEACEKQGKQAEALKAYHELVYSDQKGWGSNINSDITTRMKYVLALLRNNQWPDAVAVYDMAIKSNAETNHGRPVVDAAFASSRRETARLQAVAHLVLGISGPTWEPASGPEQRKHILEAVRLQPDLPMVQFVYAQMLEKEGNYAGAKAAYQKAAVRASGDLKTKAQGGYQRIAGWQAAQTKRP